MKRKLIPECRKINNLSGPIFLSYYPNLEGRRILILGERHDNESICKDKNVYEVHQWIKDLAENSSYEIDLFLESRVVRKVDSLAYQFLCMREKERNGPIKLKTLKDFDCPLTAIRNMFSYETYYKNLNYISVDSRFINYNEHSFIDFFVNNEDDFFNIVKSIISEKKYSKEDIISLISYISGYSRTNKKIYSEFHLAMYNHGIASSNDKKGDIYQKSFFELIDNIKGIIDLEKFYKHLFDSYEYIFDDENMFADIITVIHMDVYFLLNYLLSNGKYIIVYSGAAHSLIYNDFFSRWYNVNPKIEIENENSCIHFQEEFDFFEEI